MGKISLFYQWVSWQGMNKNFFVLFSHIGLIIISLVLLQSSGSTIYQELFGEFAFVNEERLFSNIRLFAFGLMLLFSAILIPLQYEIGYIILQVSLILIVFIVGFSIPHISLIAIFIMGVFATNHDTLYSDIIHDSLSNEN